VNPNLCLSYIASHDIVLFSSVKLVEIAVFVVLNPVDCLSFLCFISICFLLLLSNICTAVFFFFCYTFECEINIRM